MERLIDANKLIYEDVECTDGNTYMVVHAPMVDAQPTAYDVDAVVKKLKQQAEQYHNRAERYAVFGVTREVEHMAGKAASYEHAIEIVKGGGVNEN